MSDAIYVSDDLVGGGITFHLHDGRLTVVMEDEETAWRERLSEADTALVILGLLKDYLAS